MAWTYNEPGVKYNEVGRTYNGLFDLFVDWIRHARRKRRRL